MTIKSTTIHFLKGTESRCTAFINGEPPNEVNIAWANVHFQSASSQETVFTRVVRIEDLIGDTTWWLAKDIEGAATYAPLEEVGGRIIAWTQSDDVSAIPDSIYVEE